VRLRSLWSKKLAEVNEVGEYISQAHHKAKQTWPGSASGTWGEVGRIATGWWGNRSRGGTGSNDEIYMEGHRSSLGWWASKARGVGGVCRAISVVFRHQCRDGERTICRGRNGKMYAHFSNTNTMKMGTSQVL
jgi:hypothetical protein